VVLPRLTLIAVVYYFPPQLYKITQAYIDPSTGGMLFQVLAILFAALSGMLLFFSRQIKTLLSRLLRFLRNRTDRSQ
jgi:hypothetical protein